MAMYITDVELTADDSAGMFSVFMPLKCLYGLLWHAQSDGSHVIVYLLSLLSRAFKSTVSSYMRFISSMLYLCYFYHGAQLKVL